MANLKTLSDSHFPGLASLLLPTAEPHRKHAGFGLLLLRLVCGLGLMLHGWKKINDPFGWMGSEATTPALFQALAAISEFFGGLAWILGLLTPLASLGILSTMTVATVRHVGSGDPFVGKGSFELPLLYLTIAILFILAGPGRYALDAWVFRKKDR